MENNKKSNIISEVISQLEVTYNLIVKKRHNSNHHNDIWNTRKEWVAIKAKLQEQLENGTFRFSPSAQYNIEKKKLTVYTAIDWIVLKSITNVLTPILIETNTKTAKCYNLKGNGGNKKALKDLMSVIDNYQYVLRTDIKSYYKSINHYKLLDLLAKKIKDRDVLRLIYDYCNQLVWKDGEYKTISIGISLGCPLSPLIGTFYLATLDQEMAKQKIFYIRYMDDILILAKTRWHLRNAIKVLEQVLNQLELLKHPDKTSIGKIINGFEFLGYFVTKLGLQVGSTSIKRFNEKLTQLYEQNARKNRIGEYIKNWGRYIRGGLSPLTLLGDVFGIIKLCLSPHMKDIKLFFTPNTLLHSSSLL
ncbi:MAG: hypothetical protein HQK49_06050 [Oligoflexia bacterium]|nr:hypothetical protein [Oligoflexia bacterium]